MDALQRVPTDLRVLGLGSFRRKNKEDGPRGDFPPLASSGVFGGGGEAVVIEANAKVGVPGKGRRADKEIGDGGGAVAEFFDEFGKPGGQLASLGG